MNRNQESLNKLFSSLVPASLQELDTQMISDSELNTLLNTKGKYLPKNYIYLLGEVISDWENKTLYDFIKLTMNNRRAGTELYTYFSISGNEIVGFAAYEVDNTKRFRPYPFVSEIKMFSFDLSKPNPVLLRDLRNLLDKLIDEYKEVTWIAVSDNPANKIYNRVLDFYNGKVNSLENGRLLEYCIYQEE